jgi:hypothetical protein
MLLFFFLLSFARNTSRTYENEPFVPLKALCVDLVPHTTHFELILYLERYKEEIHLTSNKESNQNN